MDTVELKKLAIIDANINRVAEGLRVIEDWARFFLRNEKLTSDIRQIRHGLWKTATGNYSEIIKGRDTGEDILSQTKESGRTNMNDIPKASFNRVKEGLRVLEEMGKLVSESAGNEFKKMRFKIYDIEREFYEVLASESDNRD
jgi:thiamine-phosphate pyrophosphorylase